MKQTEGEKGRSRSKQNHKQQRMERGVKHRKGRGQKLSHHPKEKTGTSSATNRSFQS